MSKKYTRDMIGYGLKDLKVVWPNNARIAVQIVLNFPPLTKGFAP